MIRELRCVLEQWETWSEIQHQCAAAKVAVSKDQLERWRLNGLLPKVSQVGKGRGAGSETRYPIGTANQAIAIIQLLSIKEKFSFVGWQLWMSGFDVDHRYWKEAIDTAIFQLRRAPAFVRFMEMKYLTDNKTVYDQLPPNIFQNTLFAKGAAKLSPNMQVLSLSLLGQIVGGQFGSFASLPNDDSSLNSGTFSKLMGFPMGPIVAGILPKYLFEIDFELQLSAISNALRDLRRTPSHTIEKITPVVRKELLTVLAIAGNLQLALPAFRKSPIGRFADAIASDQKIQAYVIVLWSVFREMETILPHDEIMELAAISNSNLAN